MSTAKKRKISGLSGLELEMSLTQLRKLREALIFEEVPESDPTPTDTFGDQLDKAIALLESRANDPLSLSFSSADESVLDRLSITQAGMLIPRGGDELRSAIESTRQRGAGELWSDTNMYKHLSFLSNTYTDTNEASSRMFIDTFFFRTVAMVLPNQRVVVMLENPVTAVRPKKSKMDTISGVIDYTALVTSTSAAARYLRYPPGLTARFGEKIVAFFTAEAKASSVAEAKASSVAEAKASSVAEAKASSVAEAKASSVAEAKASSVAEAEASSAADGTLPGRYIPQVVLELVACAKHLGKSHIRGALTTGVKWIFLVVDLDSNGKGATYWTSPVIEWRTKKVSNSLEVTVPVTSDEDDPAFIAGILSSWVPNSFSEFDSDEWFFKDEQT